MTADDLVTVFIPGTHVSPDMFADVPVPLGSGAVGAAWMENAHPCTLLNAAAHAVGLAGGDPCVLVGHSTGGAIAATAAFAFPEQVQGLLLIDSGPDMRGHATVADMLDELADPVPDEVLIRHARRNVPHGSPEEWIDAMVAYARRVGGAPAAEVLADQAATDLRTRGTFPRLPVEVLHGGLDPKRSPDDAAAWRDVFPAARVVVDQSVGHTPPLEDPVIVGAALERLVERVRSAT